MKGIFALILAMLIYAGSALAATEQYVITIKEHRFEPAEVTIPANKKVVLLVKNEDSTPEEFESHDIKREKIIDGHSQAKIFVGPLERGTYSFFGEFNPQTAQGKLIVK